MVARTEGDQPVPAQPRPSAGEWVQLHERLNRIARKCRSLPSAEVRGFIATCAPEVCGLVVKVRGNPKSRRTCDDGQCWLTPSVRSVWEPERWES